MRAERRWRERAGLERRSHTGLRRAASRLRTRCRRAGGKTRDEGVSSCSHLLFPSSFNLKAAQ
jgi:hypothetical protein